MRVKFCETVSAAKFILDPNSNSATTKDIPLDDVERTVSIPLTPTKAPSRGIVISSRMFSAVTPGWAVVKVIKGKSTSGNNSTCSLVRVHAPISTIRSVATNVIRRILRASIVKRCMGVSIPATFSVYSLN